MFPETKTRSDVKYWIPVKQSLNFLLLAHWIISENWLKITSPEKLQGLSTTGVGVGDGVNEGVGVGVTPDALTIIETPPQIFEVVGVGVGVGVGVLDGVTVGVGVT